MPQIDKILSLIEKIIVDGFQLIRKIDSKDNIITLEISASGNIIKLKVISERKPIYSISLSKKR